MMFQSGAQMSASAAVEPGGHTNTETKTAYPQIVTAINQPHAAARAFAIAMITAITIGLTLQPSIHSPDSWLDGEPPCSRYACGTTAARTTIQKLREIRCDSRGVCEQDNEDISSALINCGGGHIGMSDPANESACFLAKRGQFPVRLTRNKKS